MLPNKNNNFFETSFISKAVKTISPLSIIVLGVLLLVAIWGLFQYRKASSLQNELENLKNNPAQVAQEETNTLVKKVSEFLTLPDEQPTLATVTDPKLLRDQPFFAQAQTGDKVLIYALAKKAILYRPSTNKVIEVAPINLGNN